MKKNYVGIDISKLTFDFAHFSNEKDVYGVFDNSPSGFKKFLKVLPENCHCVMEATGPYYQKLAHFLFNHHVDASVENPLVIKKFMQMTLSRTKTDRADAKLIAAYGEKIKPKAWKKPEEWRLSLQQKQSAIELLGKQIQMTRNQIEAFKQSITKDKSPIKHLENVLKSLQKNKCKLEMEIESTLKTKFEEMYSNLLTIPSLGPKAVSSLMIATSAFTRFETTNQLQAYVGFCPRIFRSGTSVKGRGAICKLGMSQVRKILYMCSLTAIKYNHQCKAMYERLLNAGKAKKLALIAIANKLLRQAFGIAKSGRKYEENHQLSLAN